MDKTNLTLGSLFDGSGGFPLAGLLSGITPVWKSEIEPFPVLVTQRRLPFVKHYGDVSALDGAELPPVDIITFGSPCQDMSIAGKRESLGGSRSNLFYEAIRIVKEMRCATDGRYPEYIVWENVPGAFSSNKGEDFRSVLEAVCSVKDGEADIPRYEKWPDAGEIVAGDYSVAWRVLDAQYWGVPQRRRRIYLVADLADGRAGKILFESEGLSGYSAESFRSWQRAAGDTPPRSGASGVCLNDQGGRNMDISDEVTGTLRAEHSAKARSIGYEKEKAPTLRAGTVPAAVYENHSQDTRYTGPLDTAPTVSSTYGTGGNNQPFVVNSSKAYDARITSEGTKNARANVYETDTARTIDTGIPTPDRNQGGLAIVGGAHDPYREEDIAPTVDTNGANPTCNQIDVSIVETWSSSKASYHTRAKKELADTLVATDYKDPPTVSYDTGGDAPGPARNEYTVRRLTPTECARLQGFPDWWCSNLATEDPTEEDIAFWRDVFETHRKVIGTSSKPKTDRQIVKWLKDPHSDSAEYKMWGNGIALPCAWFVLAGIAYYDKRKTKEAQKDMTDKVLVTIGAPNAAKRERAENDFYATDPDVLEMLLDKETFDRRIWEPACGQGHLSLVLEAHGYDVRSTDLVHRGYGTGGVDFLEQSETWDGDIITNPPYTLALRFVEHALDIIREGNKVAMLLKVQFLETIGRRPLFDRAPPETVYISSKSIHCGRNGVFDRNGNAMMFTWIVWRKGFKGDPMIKWFNP